MNTDTFWKMIEKSREGTTDDIEQLERLRGALVAAGSAEVLDFDHELGLRMAESYRWDLWAVAFIINGGCSDDGFDYFRGWLISQGREYFEAALQDPAKAAERAESDLCECEDILGMAASVYKERTGKYPPPSSGMPKGGPVGTPWMEDQLKTLYPELWKRFN